MFTSIYEAVDVLINIETYDAVISRKGHTTPTCLLKNVHSNKVYQLMLNVLSQSSDNSDRSGIMKLLSRLQRKQQTLFSCGKTTLHTH
ncbi:hypothetical protein EB796_014080 [Bugula neritina]|uniref:Uncharacterized protein n=1 Tax=Bugula neritina TaxID=10212 RepID=A0A7J7JMR8_BUGNE|nr:hypothetical protein EB796_014080 [Bugula neritina]